MRHSSLLSATLVLALALCSRAGASAPRITGNAAPAPAVVTPHVFEVASARVHLHDLGIALGAMPDVDLGATPPLGSTRLIERAEIDRALAAAHAAPSMKLPELFRVVRKARHLMAADMDRLVRAAVDPARLPKGTTIAAVRALAFEVPDGFDNVTVDMPAPARRSGSVVVSAAVSFVVEGAVIARTTVPIELAVPAEALIPDIAKGAAVTLIIRRGLVEVTIGAVAAADADLGGLVSVLVKPSGRMIRSRVLDKDHVLSVEGS